MTRKQWEKEQEEVMNKPVGPVHYQDIRFDGQCRDLRLCWRFLTLQCHK